MRNNKNKRFSNNLFKLFLILLIVLPILFNVKTYYVTDSLISQSNMPRSSQEYGFNVSSSEICILSGNQAQLKITSDSQGGAFIVWEDERTGSGEEDIYIQKLNGSGSVQWAVNGLPICTANSWQKKPQIISDNAGGVIMVWEDNRIPAIGFNSQTDIYAQRINSTGHIQWEENGTAICTADNFQQNPLLVSDEMGGAIIAWNDYRTGEYDIYIQRINSAGDIQWLINGTAISSYSGYQNIEDMISDGTGGAIIVWTDSRDSSIERDIYTQRINSTGSVQWTVNGKKLSDTKIPQNHDARICSDGMGGAIITWMDRRLITTNIYSQRINSTGNILWTANGTSVSGINSNQINPRICSDGLGGAIITWSDTRNEANQYDLYAQRIDSMGNKQWDIYDNALCLEENNQIGTQIISDGLGGAMIVLTDDREVLDDHDIYAQRIYSNGSIQSTLKGIPVCKAGSIQWGSQLCSDGAEGAIFAWADLRNIGNNNDIYAQRLVNFNLLPPPPPPTAIPFGNVYLIFMILGIISLVIFTNRKLMNSKNII